MAYEKQTLFKIEKNMKTLDLTNLDNSDIKYKISKFPDGQQSITLDLENTIFSSEAQSVVIKSRLNSFLDLELIICANQALIELGVINIAFKLKEISLYVPYFLGARSDRKFLKGNQTILKQLSRLSSIHKTLVELPYSIHIQMFLKLVLTTSKKYRMLLLLKK